MRSAYEKNVGETIALPGNPQLVSTLGPCNMHTSVPCL